MLNRVFSAVMFILLLTGMLTLAFNIQPVRASGTIYIRADGRVDPLTASISSVDNITYTLTGNIYDSIWVERDNIVVDGTGYSVTGSGWEIGITLIASNVTVRSMTIKNFACGISLQGSSSNCSLFGNEVAGNWYGIWLVPSSSNNVLSGNNATANSECGIRLAQSSNNTLSGNYVTANYVGISLEYSSDCTLSGNVMVGNGDDFAVDGYALSDYLHSIDASNLVDGKPVYYFVNQSDIMVSADAYPEVGFLGLVECANVTVQGLSLTDTGQGLLLAFTNDSRITDNKVANNLYGIRLSHSSNNTVSGNNVTANNGYAIRLDLLSYNNVFYHNNFVNNGQQVLIDQDFYPSYTNSWDSGYPSGGNYWSDYNGIDSNHDGIGNTPYVINECNTDNYPLVTQYAIPEFPSFLILALFFVATLLAVTIYRRKTRIGDVVRDE